MFYFEYLNKDKKNDYLPLLFDLLRSNTDVCPNEFERDDFLREVSRALEKEPRQIVLCRWKDELAGFLMFYTRDNMIMIEELQLAKKHQRTRCLKLLCKFMLASLPNGIEFVEAFVDKSNSASLSLQKYLGLKVINEENKKLLHLRGEAEILKSKIR